MSTNNNERTSLAGVSPFPIIDKAYDGIVADLKELFKRLPERLRTYIELNDPYEWEAYVNKKFYSPLIYLSIVESYGDYHLIFAKNVKQVRDVDCELNISIYRIILKHLYSEELEFNFDCNVMEDNYESHTYIGAY